MVASWLLEHLSLPSITFAEIVRVLKEDGAFFFLTPNAKHPLLKANAALANLQRLQRQIVRWAYGRAAEDTFPVHYQANLVKDIERLAVSSGLRLHRVVYVDDPTYFALDRLSFKIAAGLELFLPASWKVHLIGHFIRPVRRR